MAVECDKKNIKQSFCHFKRDTLSRTFFVTFITFFVPFFTHISTPRTTRTRITTTKLNFELLSVARGQKYHIDLIPFVTHCGIKNQTHL